MGEGVVANYMPPLCNLGDNIRALANIAPDQKKCGMNVMLRQNVEQIQSMRIVGAVVEGQSNLL